MNFYDISYSYGDDEHEMKFSLTWMLYGRSEIRFIFENLYTGDWGRLYHKTKQEKAEMYHLLGWAKCEIYCSYTSYDNPSV